MRAFWTGEMSFGLVTIPCKLYTATKDLSPQFHQLHTKCGTRINMKRHCDKCSVDLAWADIGKGYEVSKGEYALFTKEELAKLEGDEGDGAIEIVQFFDPKQLAPALIDKSYWVGPGGKNPKAARGFELLRDTLAADGLYALVRVKLRTRPRLGVVTAKGKLFQLHTLRFADELVSAEGEIDTPDAKSLSDREMAQAHGLVAALQAPFDPSKNVDEYRVAVQQAADAKVAGGETHAPADETTERKVVDLADLLAASIAAKKGSKAA